MSNNIYIQDGRTINTLRPTYVAKAFIYSEEQRKMIQSLLRHNFIPHHTAIGKGNSTKKHWNVEKYRGRIGTGFKMVTTSPYSSRLNHITYFLKIA